VSAENPVAVNILDREYLIGCKPEERAGLLAAASLLDTKMREIRNASRATSLDRIAVMAALNITHELLQARSDGDAIRGVQMRLQGLDEKLGSALND